MQVESGFVYLAASAIVGLQGWILKEIVTMKIAIASITNEQDNVKKQLALSHIVPMLLLSILLFAGCQSGSNPLGNLLPKALNLPGKVLDKAAGLVTSTVTNITQEAVVTSTEIVTLDPLSMIYSTNTSLATNIVSVTNLTAVASAPVAGSIEGAKQVSGWLPPPYSDAVNAGLGAVSLALAYLVKRRNAALQAKGEQLTAVVEGVELAGAKNLPVKESIQTRAEIRNVQDLLHATVKAITS